MGKAAGIKEALKTKKLNLPKEMGSSPLPNAVPPREQCAFQEAPFRPVLPSGSAVGGRLSRAHPALGLTEDCHTASRWARSSALLDLTLVTPATYKFRTLQCSLWLRETHPCQHYTRMN